MTASDYLSYLPTQIGLLPYSIPNHSRLDLSLPIKRMSKEVLEHGELGIVLLVAFAALMLLHYLLLRKIAVQESDFRKKLVHLEKLVRLELERSRTFSDYPAEISQIEEKTTDKLELIQLQVEAMKKREGRSKTG